MKRHLWAGAAALMALTCSVQSRAATVNVTFSGQGIFGALVLTTEPASHQGSLSQNPPNTVNPTGSYDITNVTGTFSDAKAMIANANILGVKALNQVPAEQSNLLAPFNFSLLPVQNGVPVENNQVSPGLHFDNLYYPDGSPQTASDYPFHGGIFDIYGVAFTLDNGDAVNLWSNGFGSGSPLYSLAVTDGIDVLDSTGVNIVPLPGTAPLFGAALLGLGLVTSSVKRKRAVAA